jgi:hypothetical protein
MRLPLLLAACACLVPAAHAAKGHAHGEGRLDVVIDRNTLSLHLELPLDAAVGFERPPRSDKEKMALAAAARLLQEAAMLFQPTPAAGCSVQSAQVQVPFTGGDDKHGQHAHEGEVHHADIEAGYVFRCDKPAALKDIETTLFRHFKRLYRLETQRVGLMSQGGQGAQRLTPKNPVLGW